jgi:hypothetical protein
VYGTASEFIGGEGGRCGTFSEESLWQTESVLDIVGESIVHANKVRTKIEEGF